MLYLSSFSAVCSSILPHIMLITERKIMPTTFCGNIANQSSNGIWIKYHPKLLSFHIPTMLVPHGVWNVDIYCF